MVKLTADSAIVGTIGYMSPEQIRNEPLDVRSDLFQVGAVLYEALSGKPAFGGRPSRSVWRLSCRGMSLR